jgi:hypothetical protein
MHNTNKTKTKEYEECKIKWIKYFLHN